MKTKELNALDKMIGDYFTEKRIEHRYTQVQVSQLTNTNRNTYVHYEHGTRSMPLSVMKKLCILYHLDYYETFKYLDKEAVKKGIIK